MLATVRTRPPARLAALLAAFALTGALPLLEGHAAEPAHRCHCRHGPGERCTCTRCRSEAATARRAELEALPPCHRAAAEAALAEAERAPPAGVDVVTGCCGAPEQRRATLASPDPFLPPDGPAPPAPASGARPDAASLDEADVPRAPPSPPPRAPAP